MSVYVRKDMKAKTVDGTAGIEMSVWKTIPVMAMPLV